MPDLYPNPDRRYEDRLSPSSEPLPRVVPLGVPAAIPRPDIAIDGPAPATGDQPWPQPATTPSQTPAWPAVPPRVELASTLPRHQRMPNEPILDARRPKGHKPRGRRTEW